MIGLGSLLVFVALAVLVLIIIAKTAVVVPQQNAYVVERLGRFSGTLGAGFHILWPFLDVIRYRHSLKESAFDIPAQVCITRDNVQVGVDGILYLKVLNAERASYGISDYLFAITQLAQTTLRSEIGKIDLDKTFEERTNINMSVVTELDKASESWGVKVLRYEIKNITPPHDILAAMEKQMRAEREKRAVILTSEGARDAMINNAEGAKQETIKNSEARRQQQINEAEGQASAILAVATATAEGIRRVANAMQDPGGAQAVQLRVAEQYITQFGQLAKESNTLVIPANAADVASMIGVAMRVIGTTGTPNTRRRAPSCATDLGRTTAEIANRRPARGKVLAPTGPWQRAELRPPTGVMHPRFASNELRGLHAARVKYGQDITVINLSAGGVWFETASSTDTRVHHRPGIPRTGELRPGSVAGSALPDVRRQSIAAHAFEGRVRVQAAAATQGPRHRNDTAPSTPSSASKTRARGTRSSASIATDVSFRDTPATSAR